MLAQDTFFEENKLVFATNEEYLANIMKLKLEEEGIQVFVVNKKDSSYNLSFSSQGGIMLYVNQNNIILAKQIIESTNE
ncbi:MAG: DUF2007 domain-containing protein [Brumimicrobium sp.]|nr:DUF2007 domain-containing protein [Brumimicrobium sp.]MCO5268348.1 DUF2007 domain-containing protein [Brumimicrobium sp.]